MNYIERRLINYLPWMEKFGIVNGLRIARKLFPKKPSAEIISLNIPSARFPVYVRSKTSDVWNFMENFMHLQFPLPENLSPRLIIDAGANAGFATVVFLNKYPEAKVIAVEPEATNVEMIKKNCSMYDNFECIKSAIWKNNGYVKIMNPEAGKTEFRITETDANDAGSIKATTIEKILSDSGLPAIDILKLDIEGTERELFESNYKLWLDKVNVLIIELHDRFKPGCALAFYSAIEQYDFDQFSKGDNLVYVRRKN
jgi:FkbM family methyltransferase